MVISLPLENNKNDREYMLMSAVEIEKLILQLRSVLLIVLASILCLRALILFTTYRAMQGLEIRNNSNRRKMRSSPRSHM